MTKEQYAADIRNWLAELAIGAKAMMRKVRYEDGTSEFKHHAVCFDHSNVECDGIPIHHLREMCEAVDIEYTFIPVGGYSEEHKVAGHWVCEFNGVKFYTLVHEYDPEYKKWKKEHSDDGK